MCTNVGAGILKLKNVNPTTLWALKEEAELALINKVTFQNKVNKNEVLHFC
jgi:hypothetical protein